MRKRWYAQTLVIVADYNYIAISPTGRKYLCTQRRTETEKEKKRACWEPQPQPHHKFVGIWMLTSSMGSLAMALYLCSTHCTSHTVEMPNRNTFHILLRQPYTICMESMKDKTNNEREKKEHTTHHRRKVYLCVYIKLHWYISESMKHVW